MKEALITYKQWKTLNESFGGTFGSILTQPPVIGGVVGANGASDWSLEETKAKIRSYMLGEEDDSSDDDAPPKKKKSSNLPSKSGGSNPFGGGGSDDDSDDDSDDSSNPFGDDSDDSDDDDSGDDSSNPFGDDDSDDDDSGDDSSNPFGDDDSDDSDPFGDDSDDDMGGMGDDAGDDMGMGSDPMGGGGNPMGGGPMGGDDPMGGGMGDGPGGLGASAKGLVCHQCGHHEPDKNAKFCKMCGKNMDKFMKKFMRKDEANRSKDKSYKVVSSKASKHAKYNDQIGDHASSNPGDDGSIDPYRTGKEMLKTVVDGRTEGKTAGFKGVMDGKASLHDNRMGKFKVVKGNRGDQQQKPLDGFKPARFGKGGKIETTGKDPESNKKKQKHENHICGTCGSLACEVHNGTSPSADRLSQSFFRSITGQVGNRGGRYDSKFHDGVYDGMVEDALYDPKTQNQEPGPGDAGWAPQGKVGFLGGI